MLVHNVLPLANFDSRKKLHPNNREHEEEDAQDEAERG